MVALLSDDESLNDLMALPPEDILLRWFNYQLEQAGCGRRVENFSDDIKVKALKKEQGCSLEIPKGWFTLWHKNKHKHKHKRKKNKKSMCEPGLHKHKRKHW